MFKFNDNNIYVGHIKQLLKDFNLPRCRVYKNGMVKCPHSHYIKGNMLYSVDDKGTLVNSRTYRYNEKIENLTTNLEIRNNLYDIYTHKYLGNYLRFQRDYNGLNLMSMYNCFTTEEALNLDIKLLKDDGEDIKATFNSQDENYVIYVVPVRFGNKYTVGIDSTLPVEVVAGFYNNNTPIDFSAVEEDVMKFYNATYDVFRQNSLTKPIIYDKLYNIEPSDKQLYQEENLCLYLKVPSKCKSSIVVLEGDYRYEIDLSTHRLTDELFIYKHENATYGNYDYKSIPELLSYRNSQGNYLLASRLIEYLSENAITNMSENYDVKKLQKELLKRHYIESAYLGTWSEDDRKGLYKYINDTHLNSQYFDIISYCDKDVERTLGGLYEKNEYGNVEDVKSWEVE